MPPRLLTEFNIANCLIYLLTGICRLLLYSLLLNMYTNHVTKVLWNGILSSSFLVKNGVKQGSTVSLLLFCVYLDRLLKTLDDQKLAVMLVIYAWLLLHMRTL